MESYNPLNVFNAGSPFFVVCIHYHIANKAFPGHVYDVAFFWNVFI